MPAEIERKFLLDEPPEQLQGLTGERIEQGYLAVAGGVEVRLRRAGDRLLLTAKVGYGEVREEVEIGIGAGHFDALWPLTESRRLRKTRFLVPLGQGLEAEVDVYEGDLAGLVTAEVEFGFERQSRDFRPPAWLGEEVTGDHRFANQSLALDGVQLFSSGQNGKERSVSSRAYRLKTKETASAGVRRIALGRIEKAVERLDEVEESELAAAIHGARKDLKKLRALLRLVRHELGKKAFKAENRRYRDAGRLLAGSRDAEVKLETLSRLRDELDDLPAEGWERWRALLESERDQLAREDSAGQIAGAIEVIEGGRRQLGQWSSRTDSWALVGPGLARSYRDGRKAMEEALADPGDDTVHDWRKRAKDLWYQLRIVREAWPELLGVTVDQLHELADLLGDHHDLALLAADLRSHADVIGDRDEFEAAIEARQEQLLNAAAALGRRLYAEKPKAFERRIKRYWRAWRDG
jgi:CYTH domain-containing protein/CHAD domain-containing protein